MHFSQKCKNKKSQNNFWHNGAQKTNPVSALEIKGLEGLESAPSPNSEKISFIKIDPGLIFI